MATSCSIDLFHFDTPMKYQCKDCNKLYTQHEMGYFDLEDKEFFCISCWDDDTDDEATTTIVPDWVQEIKDEEEEEEAEGFFKILEDCGKSKKTEEPTHGQEKDGQFYCEECERFRDPTDFDKDLKNSYCRDCEESYSDSESEDEDSDYESVEEEEEEEIEVDIDSLPPPPPELLVGLVEQPILGDLLNDSDSDSDDESDSDEEEDMVKCEWCGHTDESSKFESDYVGEACSLEKGEGFCDGDCYDKFYCFQEICDQSGDYEEQRQKYLKRCKVYKSNDPEVQERRKELKNEINDIGGLLEKKRETQPMDRTWRGTKPFKEGMGLIMEKIEEEGMTHWAESLQNVYDDLFGKSSYKKKENTEGQYGKMTAEIHEFMRELNGRMCKTQKGETCFTQYEYDGYEDKLKDYGKYIFDKRRKFDEDAKQDFIEFYANVKIYTKFNPC